MGANIAQRRGVFYARVPFFPVPLHVDDIQLKIPVSAGDFSRENPVVVGIRSISIFVRQGKHGIKLPIISANYVNVSNAIFFCLNFFFDHGNAR